MITHPEKLEHARIVAAGGDELGEVAAIYVDTETGRPEWVGVRVAAPDRLCLIPLTEAEEVDGALRVPYAAGQVTSGPPYEVGRPLSAEDEAVLAGHYGIEYDPSYAPVGSPVARPEVGAGSTAEGRDPRARLRMYWP